VDSVISSVTVFVVSALDDPPPKLIVIVFNFDFRFFGFSGSMLPFISLSSCLWTRI